MLNKVSDFIIKNNLITNSDKIVVGVSGGPDSICLLDILHKLGYNLVACHVNHGLRKNANLDEEFVKEFCKDIGVKLHVKKINLKLKKNLQGLSCEEAGRLARYKFFNEVLEKEGATVIATAHNSNDTVETVLLNLFRGSGVTGLKGIPLRNNNIVRPLLSCTRNEIMEYLRTNRLKYCIDETNNQEVYTRNKIRLKLIPYVEKNINSNVIETIYRTSMIVDEQEDFVNNEIEKSFYDVLICDDDNDISFKDNDRNYDCITFNLKRFNNLHIMIRKRLVLNAINLVLGNTKDIEKVHVDDIVKMCQNNVGGKYLKPNKNIRISIKNKKIYFEKMT